MEMDAEALAFWLDRANWIAKQRGS